MKKFNVKDINELLGLEIVFIGDADINTTVGIMFPLSCSTNALSHEDGTLEVIVEQLSDNSLKEVLSFLRIDGQNDSSIHLDLSDTVFSGRTFDVFFGGEKLIGEAKLVREFNGKAIIPIEVDDLRGTIRIMCKRLFGCNNQLS